MQKEHKSKSASKKQLNHSVWNQNILVDDAIVYFLKQYLEKLKENDIVYMQQWVHLDEEKKSTLPSVLVSLMDGMCEQIEELGDTLALQQPEEELYQPSSTFQAYGLSKYFSYESAQYTYQERCFVDPKLLLVCPQFVKEADWWVLIIVHLDTKDWIRLSYTCKTIHNYKYNKEAMKNMKRTLKGKIQLTPNALHCSKGTIFNIDLNSNQSVCDAHLESVNQTIYSISMSDCETLTDGAFQYLSTVEILDMSCCNQFSDRAFLHLTNLTNLNIKNCRQKSLTDEAFRKLTKLKILNMTGCDSLMITDTAFRFLPNIEELIMANVKPGKMTDMAFQYLKKIRVLDISRNDYFSDEMFKPLVHLRILFINFCEQFSDRAFTHLQNVEILEMRYCKQDYITDEAFSHLKKIQVLDITGCDQISITEKAFAHILPTLTKLTINFKKLNELPLLKRATHLQIIKHW